QQVAVPRIADSSHRNRRDSGAAHNLKDVVALHIHEVAEIRQSRFSRRLAHNMCFCDLFHADSRPSVLGERQETSTTVERIPARSERHFRSRYDIAAPQVSSQTSSQTAGDTHVGLVSQ